MGPEEETSDSSWNGEVGREGVGAGDETAVPWLVDTSMLLHELHVRAAFARKGVCA